jgi:hypothetical protein
MSAAEKEKFFFSNVKMQYLMQTIFTQFHLERLWDYNKTAKGEVTTVLRTNT